jgi:hypothetical protein
MRGVEWENLIEIFPQWASQLTMANNEYEWLAIDGKSLRSTLEHYGRSQQNFVSMISVFCQDNGLVWYAQIENKHQSEIHQVKEIARTSGLKKKYLLGMLCIAKNKLLI